MSETNAELIKEAQGMAARWFVYKTTDEREVLILKMTDALEAAEGLVAHLKGEGREHGAWDEMKRQRDAALAVIAGIRSEARAILKTVRDNGSDFERGQENIAERNLELVSGDATA